MSSTDNTGDVLFYHVGAAYEEFSNFYYDKDNPVSLRIPPYGELRFPTAEHGYHFFKFKYDEKLADQYLDETLRNGPRVALDWATKHNSRVDRRWHKRIDGRTDEYKVEVMKILVRAKFSKNQKLKKLLLSTGNRRIVENSPIDDFWGLGPNGDGTNKLGMILMEIREELREGKTGPPEPPPPPQTQVSKTGGTREKPAQS